MWQSCDNHVTSAVTSSFSSLNPPSFSSLSSSLPSPSPAPLSLPHSSVSSLPPSLSPLPQLLSFFPRRALNGFSIQKVLHSHFLVRTLHMPCPEQSSWQTEEQEIKNNDKERETKNNDIQLIVSMSNWRTGNQEQWYLTLCVKNWRTGNQEQWYLTLCVKNWRTGNQEHW